MQGLHLHFYHGSVPFPQTPPTCPAVSVVSPVIILIVVLFPAPLGPRSPNTSPGINTHGFLVIAPIQQIYHAQFHKRKEERRCEYRRSYKNKQYKYMIWEPIMFLHWCSESGQHSQVSQEPLTLQEREGYEDASTSSCSLTHQPQTEQSK